MLTIRRLISLADLAALIVSGEFPSTRNLDRIARFWRGTLNTVLSGLELGGFQPRNG
jgi:hypothetical protein